MKKMQKLSHLKMMQVLRHQFNYSTKVPAILDWVELQKKLKIGSQASVVKTVTKIDILKFAELTGDCNPIHVSAEKNIVHGSLLNGLVSGVIGTKLPGPGTLVVEQLIKYPKPCYVGDSVRVTVTITSVRKIVMCKYSCIANQERVVLEGEAKLIVSNEKIKQALGSKTEIAQAQVFKVIKE